MRCPDCQSEIQDGLEVCPRCFAVLGASPEESPSDLWRDQAGFSKPEILTSAQRTGEVGAAEARAALARAQAARRKAPTGPAPRLARGPLTDPPPRRAPPAPPPQHAGTKLPPLPPGPPAGPLPVTGPLPQAAPEAGRRFGPQAQIATHIVSGDPEAQRGTQIVEVSLPPMVKQAARRGAAEGPVPPALLPEESQVSRGVEEWAASLGSLYGRMQQLDKWTLWALLLALLGCFLPWVRVRGEGLLAGIQDPAGLAGLAAAGMALGALLLRTSRRRLTGMLLLFQLLAVAIVGAAPVYRFLTAVEVQFSAGPFITVAAGGAAVLLALLRLTRPGV